jgi:hypothetical protein
MNANFTWLFQNINFPLPPQLAAPLPAVVPPPTVSVATLNAPDINADNADNNMIQDAIDAKTHERSRSWSSSLN